MKTNYTTYTYTILRYIHDTTTGEFVNVGVALYAPEFRLVRAQCQHKYSRIKSMFPGAHGQEIRAVLRHIENGFKKVASRLETQLPQEGINTALDAALKVLPKDDSALQWTPAKQGRCVGIEDELERLYTRYVSKYDPSSSDSHRIDEDVWRDFRKDLKERNLLKLFDQSKIVRTEDSEIKFEHAWKNGKWHCIQPLSFDLSSSDTIKNKAYRYLGEMTSIQRKANDLKVYVVAAEPGETSLETSFEQAIRLIGKSPIDISVYTESEKNELLDQLNEKVQHHNG